MVEEQQVGAIDDGGYELFRRAILERDEDAWAESVARYRPLLIAWANFCCAKYPIDERSDDIADRALVRAWAALSPAHFASFPNLTALLGYLRACVNATVIDYSRAQAAQMRALRRLEVRSVATPEQIVMARMEREELWRTVRLLVKTPQEYTILLEAFILGVPPRTIQAQHPDLFADIAAIYTVRRNLLNRLQRSRELQRLYLKERAPAYFTGTKARGFQPAAGG